MSTTATLIDNLGYTYGTGGNLVTNINDISQNFAGYEGGGASIGYDLNGNMTTMPDKGISSIKYNFLNLPNNMMISKNGNENIIINTKYRADGTKLRKENTTDITVFNGSISTISITDYLDGFQYLQSVSLIPPGGGGFEMLAASALSRRAMEPQAFSLVGPVNTDPTIDPPFGGGGITVDVKTPDLQFFPTAEGFYDYQKNQYIYQYKDHLGNNRVSFARNSAGVLEITDANDYYPFGMNHLKTGNAFFGNGSYKAYKYNGKELQETGMYDYGARFYMPDIGRWGVVDPLADVHPEMTPFRYSFNNPINATDPTGLLEDWYNDSDGNVSWHDSQEDNIKGSNGEDLSRLGKSGSYLNASGGVTTLNEDATVTQGGNTSILLSPEKMSSAAMGGDVISGQGTPTVFAAFDTTKYGSPGPFPLQSPVLTDPSAAMFRFYAEGLAGGYLLRGFGRILSYESAGAVEAAPVTNVLYKRPNNATTVSQRAAVQGEPCVTCGIDGKMVADHKIPLVQEHYQTGTIDLNRMRSTNAVQPQCPTCSAQQEAAMSKYSKEMKKIIQQRTNGGQ